VFKHASHFKHQTRPNCMKPNTQKPRSFRSRRGHLSNIGSESVATTIAYALRLLLFVAILLGQAGQAQEHLMGGGGVDMQLGFTGLHYEVTKMPLRVRNVPIHPDDSGSPGPIRQLHYTADLSMNFGVGYFWASESKRFHYEFGGRLNWLFTPGSSTALRNYTTAPGTSRRGSGAALTVLSLEQRGVIPGFDHAADHILNLSPELVFEISPTSERFERFSLGASVSYFRMEAVQGYDRFDAIENRRYFSLSHHIPVGLYLNYHIKGPAIFTMGAKFLPSFETSTGKSAGIDAPTVTWFTALGLRF
jgi:hypothetical protein